MRHNLKLVARILILIGVLFLVIKLFNIPLPFSKTEICPPDKCQVYELDEMGRPIGATVEPEPGRNRMDFSTVPPGLPTGIPVDPKPLKVVTSYIETMAGDKSIGELPHTQITYSYITKQGVKTTFDNFLGYLKKNNYEVQVGEENLDRVTAFYGQRVSGPTDQSITVSIVLQNQFEQLVTVSLIISERSKTNE